MAAVAGLLAVGLSVAVAAGNYESVARWSQAVNTEFARYDQEATAEVRENLRQFKQELDAAIPPPDPTRDWEAAKQFIQGLAP
jgi:hypothetical protein